jgi:predicted lipoprotein
MPSPRRTFGRNRLIGLGLLIVLLVAMVLNTKFLTPEQRAEAGPTVFDPQATAAGLFAKAKTDLPGQAQPLSEVLSAVLADPKAAATKFKAVSPAEGAYVFPVTTTATVREGSDANLQLTVPGVTGTPVLVPLSTAVNGSVLRDAMGFKFADAPGQTDYQYVGDELKKLILADVQSSVADPASFKGKKVTVVGVISVLSPTGAPPPKAKPVNIQPLTIKAAS